MRLLVLLLLSTPLPAQEIRVEWDHSLALEKDRAAYEQRLGSFVRRAYAEVAARVGWRLEGPLRVTVHSPAAYARAFGAHAQATRGAHYQGGVIHVNGGRQLDGSFLGTLQHELTHALVDYRGKARRIPLWLNEGLAEWVAMQRMGQRGLAPSVRQQLAQVTAAAGDIRLPARGPLTPFQYQQAWAAAVFVEEIYGRGALLRLVRSGVDDPVAFDRVLMRVLGDHPDVFRQKLVKWLTR